MVDYSCVLDEKIEHVKRNIQLQWILLYSELGVHWCVGSQVKGADISIASKHKAMLQEWLTDGSKDIQDKVTSNRLLKDTHINCICIPIDWEPNDLFLNIFVCTNVFVW